MFYSSFSQCAKLEPPDGSALLIVGQDLNAIGGAPSLGYTDGYLDEVGGPTPGGFTQYTNINLLHGLNDLVTQCTGHNHMEFIATNSAYDNSAIAIGLYGVGMIGDVNNGRYDANITELANWCKSHAPKPIYLRIFYEFTYQYGGEGNGSYVQAWKRIVDRFRELDVNNVAFVWQAAWGDFNNWGQISGWYPGDDYVDWFGYSQWTFDRVGRFMIEEAARRGKPCMIAESAYYFNSIQASPNGDHVWNDWFQKVFDLFEEYDNLKAWALINSDWESLGCWANWGDQRIQNNEYIKDKWLEEISKPFWLKASSSLYNTLNDCSSNAPLSVNAGSDISLNLPVNSAEIKGIASGGTNPYSYSWDQISGAPVTINNANSATMTVSGLEEGEYQFELTVTDQNNNSATDLVTIAVHSVTRSPYTQHMIPGTIQLEEYDNDGAGVAYFDSSPGNQGNAFRDDDVDIGDANNGTGGYVVAWTTAGEWLEYTVNIEESGFYTIRTNVATTNSGNSFSIDCNGQDLTGNVAVPNTGSWDTYENVVVNGIHLNAGDNQLIRYNFTSGGFNVDFMDFELDIIDSNPESVYDNNNLIIDIYPNPCIDQLIVNAVNGQDDLDILIMTLNGELLDRRRVASGAKFQLPESMLPGIYVMSVKQNNTSYFYKLVKSQ